MVDRVETKAYATLRLSHVDLDPDQVTAKLGVQPSHAHRAGDRREVGAPYQLGMWSLSTEGHCESSKLGDHVELLLSWISHSTGAIRGIVDAGVEGDVFCYALNSVSGSVSLTASQIEGLSQLGLAYDVDIYHVESSPPRGRRADEIRLRTRSLLNHALRRPGMWGGEIVLGSMIADLAFSEGRESDLRTQAEWLREQCAWTSTGVRGAFEDFRAEKLSEARVASVYAMICHQLGWCDLDTPLDDGRYWRVRNGAPEAVRSGRLTAFEGLVKTYGEPTIRVGPSQHNAVGYLHSASDVPAVWFDITADAIVGCRVATGLLANQFIPTPGTTIPTANDHLGARRGAPLPYWAQTYTEIAGRPPAGDGPTA